jgi:hypothetical protein
MPPQHPEVCCFCGGNRIRTSGYADPEGHGPYLPLSQRRVVIKYVGGDSPCTPEREAENSPPACYNRTTSRKESPVRKLMIIVALFAPLLLTAAAPPVRVIGNILLCPKCEASGDDCELCAKNGYFRFIPCAQCGGLGDVQDVSLECPRCGGNGWILLAMKVRGKK